jgi:hypothetical protein
VGFADLGRGDNLNLESQGTKFRGQQFGQFRLIPWRIAGIDLNDAR